MVIEDTLNWLKGKHSLTIGGSATRGDVWLKNQRLVPTVTLGIATGDPADAMFNTANFPGASSTDLTNASNLYTVLTGRVSVHHAATRESARTARPTTSSARACRRAACGRSGLFAAGLAGAWKPNLTVNAGAALRSAAAVLRAEQQLLDADHRRPVRHHGPGGDLVVGSIVTGTRQPVQAGRARRARRPRTRCSRRTRRPTTPTGTTSRRASARPGRPAPTSGFLHTILGAPGDSVIRGGYNIVLPARRHERLHRGLRQQPGHPDRRHAEHDERQPRDAAGAVRGAATWAPPSIPPDARVSDDGAVGRARTSGPSTRTSRCRGREPAPSASSARSSKNMARSRCATSTRTATTAGRSRNLDRAAELQRDQHRREQVHRRVQAGAGQPRGEHRGRQGQRRFAYTGAPARARCRSSWRT